VATQQLIWVGIDVGKSSHHACAMDTDGTVVFSEKVANQQAAIENLIAHARDAAVEVRWAVDLTSSAAALLIATLAADEQHVVYVPGRVVHQMTGAFRGESKSDAKDARVIAETARMRRDLTVLVANDALVVELSRLTSHRADLVGDWVRGVNRLRDLLLSIFPGLEQAFDYTNRSPLVLLTGFQTPAAIRAAGIEGVAAFLRSHGAWPSKVTTLAASAVAVAHAQTVQLPGEAVTAELVASQATRLLDLQRQIQHAEKLMHARFRTHPQAEIIESLTGMGPTLGAEFIVAIGGNLGSFASAGQMASYAGLVPVPKDSGRISGNLRRPKRYNRRLRRVFYMTAMCSLKAGGASRVFYDRKRGERLTHKQALLALARRLVDVLWALLRDGRLFTPVAPPLAPVAA